MGCQDRFEEEYDKNKDGILDATEMRAWLVPDITQTASEETNHLFKVAPSSPSSSRHPMQRRC